MKDSVQESTEGVKLCKDCVHAYGVGWMECRVERLVSRDLVKGDDYYFYPRCKDQRSYNGYGGCGKSARLFEHIPEKPLPKPVI